MIAPWMLESYHGGTGTFKVRKPKVLEGDELISRAEEVNTSKALKDVKHIEPERFPG